jgi:ribosomal protein L37AE/L43A
MSYSKEAERQNKVLGDLLTGRDSEKRIMVGYNSGKEPEKQGDKIDRLSEVMKDARMPWFCPECKKTMKKKLDTKFWRLENQCFDCHVEMENKLRMSGKYEKYEKGKVFQNKKAYLKDLKQSIDEFEQTGGKAEFFNEVGVVKKSVEKEDWSMGQENFDKLVKEAREHIEKLEMELEDEQKTNTV